MEFLNAQDSAAESATPHPAALRSPIIPLRNLDPPKPCATGREWRASVHQALRTPLISSEFKSIQIPVRQARFREESGADIQGRRHQSRRYAGNCARGALRRLLKSGQPQESLRAAPDGRGADAMTSRFVCEINTDRLEST
eukprot:358646-Hanusia_phi.AAC.1